MARKVLASLGFNNIGGLTELNPQPFVNSVREINFLVGGDGVQYSQGGKFVTLDYSSLEGTDFESLLNFFGFLVPDVFSVEITIRTRYSRTFYRTFNAIIHKPISGTDYKETTGDMVKDVKFFVSDMELI